MLSLPLLFNVDLWGGLASVTVSKDQSVGEQFQDEAGAQWCIVTVSSNGAILLDYPCLLVMNENTSKTVSQHILDQDKDTILDEGIGLDILLAVRGCAIISDLKNIEVVEGIATVVVANGITVRTALEIKVGDVTEPLPSLPRKFFMDIVSHPIVVEGISINYNIMSNLVSLDVGEKKILYASSTVAGPESLSVVYSLLRQPDIYIFYVIPSTLNRELYYRFTAVTDRPSLPWCCARILECGDDCCGTDLTKLSVSRAKASMTSLMLKGSISVERNPPRWSFLLVYTAEEITIGDLDMFTLSAPGRPPKDIVAFFGPILDRVRRIAPLSSEAVAEPVLDELANVFDLEGEIASTQLLGSYEGEVVSEELISANMLVAASPTDTGFKSKGELFEAIRLDSTVWCSAVLARLPNTTFFTRSAPIGNVASSFGVRYLMIGDQIGPINDRDTYVKDNVHILSLDKAEVRLDSLFRSVRPDTMARPYDRALPEIRLGADEYSFRGSIAFEAVTFTITGVTSDIITVLKKSLWADMLPSGYSYAGADLNRLRPLYSGYLDVVVLSDEDRKVIMIYDFMRRYFNAETFPGYIESGSDLTMALSSSASRSPLMKERYTDCRLAIGSMLKYGGSIE